MIYRDDDPPDYPELPECCDTEMEFDEVAMQLKCLECGKVVAAKEDPDEGAIGIMFGDTMEVGDRLTNRHTGASYEITKVIPALGDAVVRIPVAGELIRLSATDIMKHWVVVKQS